MGDARAQNTVRISIDGRPVTVAVGTTVAVAVWNHGIRRFRVGVAGAGRGPLCGMGICYECRLTIDGQPGRRSCLLPCVQGMCIETATESECTEPAGGTRDV